MARPLRIEYPGALYHITSRGNEKKDIFASDRDRKRFLATLSDVVKTYNWICHAYCLMGNHYHLLIETPEGNLSDGMRQLNGVYTQLFNKTRKRVGHLLQGRFKAFLIEKETYLLEVARYIVLNPVRANMVTYPEDWRWSSYRAMIGLCETPDFLTTNDTLRHFGDRRSTAIKRYAQFVLDGVGVASPFEEVQHGSLLGSPQFIDVIWKLKDTEYLTEIPRNERFIGRPELQDLFAGKINKATRDRLIRFARENCGYQIKDIADELGLHYSTVSKVCSNSHFKT